MKTIFMNILGSYGDNIYNAIKSTALGFELDGAGEYIL